MADHDKPFQEIYVAQKYLSFYPKARTSMLVPDLTFVFYWHNLTYCSIQPCYVFLNLNKPVDLGVVKWFKYTFLVFPQHIFTIFSQNCSMWRRGFAFKVTECWNVLFERANEGFPSQRWCLRSRNQNTEFECQMH